MAFRRKFKKDVLTIAIGFAVSVNGEVLAIEDAVTQSTKRSIPTGDGTTMQVTWKLFAPGIGPFVEVETGELQLMF